jgi:putative tryptophan/tyrosine transport system substrate-binding protein
VRPRRFITILAAATAWSIAGRAEHPQRMRRVGVLMFSPENDPFTQAIVTAFAQALERCGWIGGKNIRIDYRFASGDPSLFKNYAAELIGLTPDAILASTTPAVVALRQQTRTIPIVFVLGVDPVRRGWVQSLARPGGTLTGFISWDAPLMGKWLQLLKEAAPGAMRVAVIFNPDTAPFAPFLSHAIETAAPSFGVTMT